MDMGSYSFYYGDGGAKKRAAALGPIDVLIIHDEYTGDAGDDLNGRTPDTLNTPGGLWTAEADDFEMDGLGNLKNTTSPQLSYIPTGITDNKMRAEEGSSNTSRSAVGILRDANLVSTSRDGLYATRVNTFLLIDQIIESGRTILFNSGAGFFPDNNLHTYGIEYDGDDLKLYADGAVVDIATQSGYGMPAGLDGNEYVGTECPTGDPSPTATVRTYLKAWDLP
jgi:hypothetical protein